jgi:hypothetical protein
VLGHATALHTRKKTLGQPTVGTNFEVWRWGVVIWGMIGRCVLPSGEHLWVWAVCGPLSR